MFKKVFSLVSFLLILILIPTAFAIDDNSTDLSKSIDEEPILTETLLEIHVDTNGSDDNQGDISHPVSTIKKAIDISSNNSKIIVHEGTYKENNLNISKSLEIHGQGNVIIDAENKNRIFTIHTSELVEKVYLSGITFINGNSEQAAGAIYVLGAITTVDNCRFINNTAATEGGAIFWNSDSGRLTNCVIEGNYARVGAGVEWGQSDTSLVLGSADYGQIINCTFDNNHILQDNDTSIGLSIYSNRMTVADSRFINHKTDFNTSFEVLYINGDYGTVKNCLFENNSLTLTGALGLDGNYAVVYGNTFINNTVSSPESFGGAIGIQSETGNIYNNTFISNGGEECCGGAVYVNIMEDHQFSFINITNNVFKDNYGIYGGNIFANGQNCMLTLRVNNNVFTSSRARTGAGIYAIHIYDPIYINDNEFVDLNADTAAGIYSSDCILYISNNLMTNCTSLNSGDICSNDIIYGNLKLKFNDIVSAVNQTTTLTAVLTDDMNNSISTNNINFLVDGNKLTGRTGRNNFTTVFYSTGNFTISGNYEYGAKSVENATLTLLYGVNFNISKVDYYGKHVLIKVNLTDSFSNPIRDTYIVLNLNGNDILVKTDGEGIAKGSFDLDFGNYNVTARFEDDLYYKSANLTAEIHVFPSIISHDMTRGYNSGMDFSVMLFDADGLPLVNSSVTFEVNGKKYEAITDFKGNAILNKKLSVGFYNVNVLNPFTGEEASNSLNVVKRISGNKNIKIYFGTKSTYSVRLYDDDGEAVGANEIVKITVNGKSHNVKTDKNGYASFAISLNPKTYTITATYKGFKVSNKIVVKPVLTAKNISKKKAKTIKFTAKLVNTKGKALKGKKITFKIKGKTYKVKTNKKGLATVSLKNLKVGKHTITSKYGKSSIKNTIKIK